MFAATGSLILVRIAARTARLAAAMTTALTIASAASAAPSAGGASADSERAGANLPIDIRGTIRDANGNPVRNATIRLMSEADTLDLATDRSGRFHGRIPTRKGVAMRVRAPGYRDLVRFVAPATRRIGLSLTLPPPYPMSSVTVIALLDPASCSKSPTFSESPPVPA